VKVLKASLLALLLCFGASAADELQELENSISTKTHQLTVAQSRLKSAEASLKSNTDALIRAKSPQEQKTVRNYVAIAQSRVAEERSSVTTIQREVETLKVKIVAIKKAEAEPELKLNVGTQTTAAPAKPAAPKALHTVVMKDGRRIECLRFMEVENEYALQLPDKKFQNVKKVEVAEIVSP
jgi:hypothetical protein